MWGWVLLTFVLTAPIVWPWYVLWVLPVACLLPHLPRLALVAICAILPIGVAITVDASASQAMGLSHGIGLSLVGPLFLAFLVWLVLDLRHRLRSGANLETEIARRPVRDHAASLGA
jgi:hypothetical protein